MKKNNTAEKAAINAEKISKALKEGTEKSFKRMLNEAITNIITESEDDEDENVETPQEDDEDNSYDVEDVDTETTDNATDDNDEPEVSGGEEGPEEGDAEDDWSGMEQYKVGDNDYDFTNADDEDVLKVYNLMNDSDEIAVKKEEDGTYSFEDPESGAEYVIELDPSAAASADSEDDEFGDDEDLMDDEDDFEDDEDFDAEDDSEVEPDSDEDSYEIEIGDDEEGLDDEDDFEDDAEGDDDSYEIEIGDDEEEDFDDDDDEEQINETDLGYTDSYQKDVFANKFNMSEPAKSDATYSMDAGAPKGAEKPWAGKGDQKPFGAKSDTIDEGSMTTSSQSVAKTSHTPTSEPRANNKREVAKLVHHNGQYDTESLNETITKIVKAAKAIQLENKQYKEAIENIKQSLHEAAVLNVSLGQALRLVCENSTTKDEKKNIVESFNAVKTIKESKELYARFSRQLNESRKASQVIVEHQTTAAPSKTAINETTFYNQVKNNDPSVSLMRRMDNLYKK